MNNRFKILIFSIAVIGLSVVAYKSYCGRKLENLASMIRSGDDAGVSKLLKEYPKLADADLIWQTRAKPLDLAASLGQEKVCSVLIAAGADVNSRDVGGETPLFFAFGACNTNVIAMLLQHGANVSVTNSVGQTPLDFADRSGNDNAVRMLLAAQKK
jgi:ankyrin repeat protein